jgi:gas vesicle protein
MGTRSKSWSSKNRSSTAAIVSILSAFAIGSLIGAGVALLTAPQAGLETRRMIKEKSIELKDRAAESIGDTREKANHAVNSLVDKTRETTTKLRKRGEETVNTAMDR